jgi:hypothetical protein
LGCGSEGKIVTARAKRHFAMPTLLKWIFAQSAISLVLHYSTDL